jgi:YbbR domain-containing protein
MSEIKEGRQEVTLSRDLVRRPSSLSVIAVSPEKITLTAYQMLEIDIPIEVRTRGRVAPGLALVGIEVSPETVPVMISSKFDGGSLRLLTEPIDLGSIGETATLSAGLILPEGARFVDEKPPEAEVEIKVRRKEQGGGAGQ